MLNIKKILLWLLIVCVVVVGGWVAYVGYPIIQERFFPNENQKRIIEGLFPKLKSIIIRNDLPETVFAECTRGGNVASDYYEEDRTIMDTQGKARIFVPEKGGWFIVEYPYPYPLTEQKSWIKYGPEWVVVNLSNLISSVESGEVECSMGIDREVSEKKLVKDIKVTFEPGPGPKK